MLLYLNADTWSDERLAEQVKQARQDKLKIVMAHENDTDLSAASSSIDSLLHISLYMLQKRSKSTVCRV